MGLSEILKKPFLRRERACERCGSEFGCEIGLKGCWCTSVELSEATRKNMGGQYKDCLCRNCLEALEGETAETAQ
jgi:hypothetical protein